MWALVADNLWHGYETPAEIPLALRPPVKTPQEIAAEIAAREAKEAKNAADSEAARQYTKLANLTEKSPAEVQTWVAGNVNTIADVKDALTTLAIAISVLGRPLAEGYSAQRSGPPAGAGMLVEATAEASPELAPKSPPKTMWQKTVAATKRAFSWSK